MLSLVCNEALLTLTYICPSTRYLGITIAVVLLLAFVERPSSLSTSSDPRQHSPRWNPPCGLTESIELICLFIFSLDLAVKVNTARVENTYDYIRYYFFICFFIFIFFLQNTLFILTNFVLIHLFFNSQGYLIGWEEFRKNKWLISYTVVIAISIVDSVLSVSMVCDEVRQNVFLGGLTGQQHPTI